MEPTRGETNVGLLSAMPGLHALRAWMARERIGHAGHRDRVAAVLLVDLSLVPAVANPRRLIVIMRRSSSQYSGIFCRPSQ